MTKDALVQSAAQLESIAPELVDEYRSKHELLVAAINQLMLQRADIHELLGGEKNIPMMQDNHHNHARFVVSILLRHEAEMLVDTVLWVFRSYRSRGFHQNYWAAQINSWIEVLQKNLSPECVEAVSPLYEWFSVNIPAFSDLSDGQLAEGGAHGPH